MSSFFNPKDGDEFEKAVQATLKRLEEQVIITRLVRKSMEKSLEALNGNVTNGNTSNGNSNGHKEDNKPNNY